MAALFVYLLYSIYILSENYVHLSPAINYIFGFFVFILLIILIDDKKLFSFSFFIVLIYLLPVSNLAFELGFNFGEYKEVMYRLTSHRNHTLSYEVTNEVIRIAWIGLCSIAVGLGLLRWESNVRLNTKFIGNFGRVELTLIFLVLVASTFISMPPLDIFDSIYTSSHPVSVNINFSSAWQVPIFCLAYFVAGAVDRNSRTGLIISAGMLLVFLFYAQLARGEREALPAYAAIAIVLISRLKFSKYAILHSALFAISLLFIADFIGYARSEFAHKPFILVLEEYAVQARDASRFLFGTWTGSLMSLFSVVGDFKIKEIEPLGLDYYRNLILSLPPGFVADWFDYTRPISLGIDPSQSLTMGSGGYYGFVMPYWSFGIWGVASISICLGLFYGWLNRLCDLGSKNCFLSVFGFIVFVGFAPHWVWYGDKILINTIVYFCVFLTFRYVVLRLSSE